MAKVNYFNDGSVLGLAAAEQLDIETVLRDDRDMRNVRAEAGAIRAAEGAGVKKTALSFRDGFVQAFVRKCTDRQHAAVEAAKPIFWGTTDAKRNAWDSSDTRLWTLYSVMDDIRSEQKEIAQRCESLVRDAQRTVQRLTAQLDTDVVNDRLYPVYDENLGQMGIRVDTGIAKLRQLQESMRTMVGLCGMRLPTRAELVAAGLVKEEEVANV